jgi:hypothetical protein
MSNDILAAAECLADLLARENEALRLLDFAAAAALLPAKERALLELTRQPRMAVTATPPAVAGQRRLIELAKENQALLERAIAVQTRVIRIVARARSDDPAVARYGLHATPIPSNRATAMAVSTRA